MRALELALAERYAEREVLQEQIASKTVAPMLLQADDLAAQLVDLRKRHLLVLQKVNLLLEHHRVKGDFDEYVKKSCAARHARLRSDTIPLSLEDCDEEEKEKEKEKVEETIVQRRRSIANMTPKTRRKSHILPISPPQEPRLVTTSSSPQERRQVSSVGAPL
jgi:hypothetical protein